MTNKSTVAYRAESRHAVPAGRVAPAKKAAPEKIKDIRAGQLAPSKAVSDLSAKGKSRKKEIAFADQVYHKWTLWVNRFDLKQRLEVMQLVHSWTKPEKVRRYCA